MTNLRSRQKYVWSCQALGRFLWKHGLGCCYPFNSFTFSGVSTRNANDIEYLASRSTHFNTCFNPARSVAHKGRHTRRDWSLRLVPATSPGDQVPSCELPIFIKNLVAGTKIWSLRLVPRIQTWFDFVGQVPSNYASPCV